MALFIAGKKSRAHLPAAAALVGTFKTNSFRSILSEILLLVSCHLMNQNKPSLREERELWLTVMRHHVARKAAWL